MGATTALHAAPRIGSRSARADATARRITITLAAPPAPAQPRTRQRTIIPDIGIAQERDLQHSPP